MPSNAVKAGTIGLAVASLVGIVGCAAPGVPAAGDGPSSVSVRNAPAEIIEQSHSAQPARSQADADAVETTPESASTISATDLTMMADYGDTAVPVSAQDNATRKLVRVTASDARQTAFHAMGFLSGSHIESVTLVRLTDSKYGPEATVADSTSRIAAGDVVPIIKDRLVWLVIFSHFAMPEFGPKPSGAEARTPDDVAPNGRMWIAVDALTGDALLGSSIQNRE